jgi:hypothetical protein
MASQDEETRVYSIATGAGGRRPVAVGRTLPRRRHLRRSLRRPAVSDRHLGVLLVLVALLLAMLFLSAIRFGPLGALRGPAVGDAPTATALAVVPASLSAPSATPSASPALDPGSTAPTRAPVTPVPVTPAPATAAGPTSASPTPAATPVPTARSVPTPRPTPAPIAGLSAPSAAVVAFYNAVEAHDWDTAISLWSASMQRRYPPDEWLIARFSRTTRIDILSVHRVMSSATRATVAVTIREYRTVEPSPRRFVGDWDLILVDGRWLLDDPDF